MQLQVTLYCADGRYKPVSTIVEIPTKEWIANNVKPYTQKGAQKICNKKGWTQADIKRLGYTKVKFRAYDKIKIQQENEKRYEEIKRERGWV